MIPKTLLNPPTGVLPFDMFHSFGPMLDKQAWTPPYDIYETDREIVLKVELPEMHNEDVRVTLENGVLTVTLPKNAAATPRQIEVEVL
jgi:HSP20 family molecular chaperone IbpA